jgi:polysaccharide biosynthesis/export protein
MSSRSKRIRITFTTVLFAVMALAPGVMSQTSRQPQAKPSAAAGADSSPQSGIVVAPDDDYRIGPRDVIEVRIEDAPELSQTFSVKADGTFLMPYLKSIKAEGKTTEELAQFIADGLRGRYLKDPQVLVAVKQFYSRTFFIQGKVSKPGVYQVEGKPSLLKLISIAGGLSENHGSTAFIIREIGGKKADSDNMGVAANPVADSQDQDGDGPDYLVKAINIAGLLKGQGTDISFHLEPGDIVNIPASDVFYVAGEVNAPGQFTLSDGTTLRQAMALAQGSTFNAAPSKGSIFRVDPGTGKREEIKVDINAVMKNRKDDIAIMANDVIIVPNSKGKTIGNAILKAFGLGAAQRGPYR